MKKIQLGRENIQDIFIYTLSFFTLEIHVIRRFILGNVNIFSFFRGHLEYLAQLSTLFVCCNAKSFIFSHVLKPNLEGAFQRSNFEIFYTSE